MIESQTVHLEIENPWDYLTERQKEITILRLQGYRNAKIAEMLQIEPATVRTHLRAICRVVRTDRVRESLDILRPFQGY